MPKPHTMETLLALVEQVTESGCWIFLGRTNQYGYGYVYFNGIRGVLVHRLFYEHFRGPIPTGLDLDHLCRVHPCVNPWHCEPVTNRVNILRGISPFAINARKTHCIYGHEFTIDNTRWKKGAMRQCRACDANRHMRDRLVAYKSIVVMIALLLSGCSHYGIYPDICDVSQPDKDGSGGYTKGTFACKLTHYPPPTPEAPK